MPEAVDLGNDPFLTHTKVAKERTTMGTMPRPRSRQRLGMDVPSLWDMAIAPTLMFLGVSLAFAFGLFLVPLLPWLVLGACLMAQLGPSPDRRLLGNARLTEWGSFEGQVTRTGEQPPDAPVAPRVMGLAALFFGFLAGVYVYETYSYLAMAISIGPWYTNVLASNPAAAYGDAGALRFSDSSVVDTSRAAGYRRLTTYCAAPVLSASPPSTEASFWAVGLDCCGPRGSFWCGGAGDARARSAVKEPPRGWLFSHARDGYDAAVLQAEAVYGLTSGPERTLLRWVEDPVQVRNEAFTHAVAMILGSAALFLGVGILVHAFQALRAGKPTGR